MTTGTESPRASSYFEIRVEHERVSRLRMAGRRIATLFLWLVDPTFLFEFEPKYRSTVHVIRSTDGDVMADYEHDHESTALDHAQSLRERLDTMSIADFARDLGIGAALF